MSEETNSSVGQAQAFSPKTTGVFVILTVKAGVKREQVMAVMPAEIRETVQLYLSGKIREWYSRGDGRGAVFLLETSDVAEAQAIMESLPLAKQIFSTTSTSQSDHSFRSACSWPIPSASNQDGRQHLTRDHMPPATIFQIHLILGYVPWLLFVGVYMLPWLKSMDQVEAQRAIATLHSFRFFGLVFIVPGVVGPNLPAGFATFAAYGDFATGVLAMLALLTVRIRPLFWAFVVAFNVVGAVDIIVDYYHGNQIGLPALAGELGATYAIPIIYVPILMITHVIAFYLLVRSQGRQAAE